MTVTALASDRQGKGGSEAQQRLALLALGSIGRMTDLSSYSDVQPVITGKQHVHPVRDMHRLQQSSELTPPLHMPRHQRLQQALARTCSATRYCDPQKSNCCSRREKMQHAEIDTVAQAERWHASAGALQSDTTSEDVKGAAALALGGVAVGNLGAYLPALLTAVRGAVSPVCTPPSTAVGWFLRSTVIFRRLLRLHWEHIVKPFANLRSAHHSSHRTSSIHAEVRLRVRCARWSRRRTSTCCCGRWTRCWRRC